MENVCSASERTFFVLDYFSFFFPLRILSVFFT